jgi:hypothetical protein
MEQLMKANPIITPEDASTSGFITHLKNQFRLAIPTSFKYLNT